MNGGDLEFGKENASQLGVFSAAQYICALADGQLISRGDAVTLGMPSLLDNTMFEALYVVYRELRSPKAPDFSFGGASAGSTVASKSLFVTSECVRALLKVRRTLRETGEFIDEVARLNRMHRDAVAVSACFRSDEMRDGLDVVHRQIRGAVSSVFDRYDGRTVIVVPQIEASANPASDAVARWLTAVVTGLVGALVRFHEGVRHVHKTLDGTKSIVDMNGRNQVGHILEYLGELQQLQPYLNDAHGMVPSILSNSAGAETAGRHSGVLNLDRARDIVRRLCRHIDASLEPTQRYAENAMSAILIDDATTRDRTADLAFATSIAGAISGNWLMPAFTAAATALMESVGENGIGSVAPPFTISADGMQRRPVSAHVVRNIAYVVQHTPAVNLSVDTVRGMLRVLRDGAVTPMRIIDGRSEPDYDGGLVWSLTGRGDRSGASAWRTAVAVLAANRLARMLDTRINNALSKYFEVRQAKSLKCPMLHELAPGDIGLSLAATKDYPRPTISEQFDRLGAWMHRARTEGHPWSPESSIILFGPPGTGKTTYFEALAKTMRVPLVVVSPADFVFKGEDEVEARAFAVMRLLGMFTSVVILFDEFDPMLRIRKSREQGAHDQAMLNREGSVFAFLTNDMLLRFVDLSVSARENRFVFGLATNHVSDLDPAAVRTGRFSLKAGVYAPDAYSRLLMLGRQHGRLSDAAKGSMAFSESAALEYLKQTVGLSAAEMLSDRGVLSIDADSWGSGSSGLAWGPFLRDSSRQEAFKNSPNWPFPSCGAVIDADGGGGDASRGRHRMEILEGLESDAIARLESRVMVDSPDGLWERMHGWRVDSRIDQAMLSALHAARRRCGGIVENATGAS